MSIGADDRPKSQRPAAVRQLRLPWRPEAPTRPDQPGFAEALRRERAGVQGAHERLLHLYEIGRVLARFEGVERTMSEVVDLVARAIPLRNAILILEGSEGPRSILWRSASGGAKGLANASAHARWAYSYLVAPADVLDLPPAADALAAPTAGGFLVLPFVVDDHPIFGALLVECEVRPLEVDLVFMSAVVNQVSLALDRQARIDAAEASRLWLETVVEQIPAGVVVRKSGQAEGVGNRRAEEIWADARGGATTSTDTPTAFHPATGLAYAPEEWPLARSLATREVVRGEEIELHWEDGSLHTLLASSSPLGDGSAAAIGTFFDITSQKRAENAQRVLAEVGEVLVSSPDITTTLARVASVVVPRLADVCYVDLALGNGSVRRYEGVISERATRGACGEVDLEGHVSSLKSSLEIPLEARGVALGALTLLALEADRYSPEEVTLAADLGRRLSLAIDSSRLYEEARESARLRQNVLAVVSHDLRGPLSVILLTIASALKEPENADRRLRGRRELERIKRSASRMATLIEDLLDTASIEAGRFALSTADVSVAVVVAEAIDAVRPLARATSIHLEKTVDRGLPTVRADARRIHQVLANLLGNAIKFTPAGGTVATRIERARRGVTISVTDGGPGIAPADVHRVFDRFWQQQQTAHLGTGLGLFIARTIVEAHGGKIWVTPPRRKGATFSFFLPSAGPTAPTSHTA